MTTEICLSIYFKKNLTRMKCFTSALNLGHFNSFKHHVYELRSVIIVNHHSFFLKKEAFILSTGKTMLLIPLYLFKESSNLRLHLCLQR